MKGSLKEKTFQTNIAIEIALVAIGEIAAADTAAVSGISEIDGALDVPSGGRSGERKSATGRRAAFGSGELERALA